MERSRGIESLRRTGSIKQEQLYLFEELHLPIASTITDLIHTSPQNRPTASDLLDSVFDEICVEKLFNKEEIDILKQKIIAQETKINNQNDLILKQQAEIQTLKDIVTKYKK